MTNVSTRNATTKPWKTMVKVWALRPHRRPARTPGQFGRQCFLFPFGPSRSAPPSFSWISFAPIPAWHPLLLPSRSPLVSEPEGLLAWVDCRAGRFIGALARGWAGRKAQWCLQDGIAGGRDLIQVALGLGQSSEKKEARAWCKPPGLRLEWDK